MDGEVGRLIRQREQRTGDTYLLLQKELDRDPLPAAVHECGHLYLVAEPQPGRSEMALDVVRGQGAQMAMNKLLQVAQAARVSRSSYQPDINAAIQFHHRADGAARSSAGLSQQRSIVPNVGIEEGLLDVEVSEDGVIRIFCGGAVRDLGAINDVPQVWVIDDLIIGLAGRLLVMTRQVADDTGYLGSWALGIAVTGLRRRRSLAGEHVTAWAPQFTQDQYLNATAASHAELSTAAARVMNRLVGGLLRGLGSDQLFREWIDESYAPE